MTYSVVMAHYRDFSGVWATIQSARMAGVRPVQLLIVDQSANVAPRTHEQLQQLARKVPGMVVLPYTEAVGTSPGREKAIRATIGEVVICLDSHVLITSRFADLVLDHFRLPARRRDIVSGPMLHDDQTHAATHMNPMWGSDRMWGVWGETWMSPTNQLRTVYKGPGGEYNLAELPTDLAVRRLQDVTLTSSASDTQRILRDAGYRPWLAVASHASTIEIPAHGLGAFAVWRDNWVGFPTEARGFGGEEVCTHELVRQQGGKAVCIRGCTWLHRFAKDPEIPGHPVNMYDRARNYWIWFNRLQRPVDELVAIFGDQNLEGIREEFAR